MKILKIKLITIAYLILWVNFRLIEHIISKQLILYIKSDNLFFLNQYDFISVKSTELQLEKCLKLWYNELNNKKYIDIIYIYIYIYDFFISF